jgi:DNA-directed RNA polymerase subunit RPC12/RpoP
MTGREPKILIADLETAPSTVYTWGLYDQNIGTNQVVRDGYVLCWAAKWYNDKRIMSDALINYPDTFSKDPTNDKNIAISIWKLIDEADIVVTHNGQSFDLKWLNSIFIKHGLPPSNSYKSIDTFLVVKNQFRFLSNKLDFLCKKLDIGAKISTGGFELWEECMKGVRSSWKKMVKYCQHDVKLLEELYRKIRPFMKNHPNLSLYRGTNGLCCPECSSKSYVKNGMHYYQKSAKQRYQCLDCGRRFV